MEPLLTSQPKIDDNLSDVLPRDIMLDILSRLPAKSLIQFKSVSKPWYNLHTDPIFIQMQLNQTKKHTTNEQLVFIESQNSIIHIVSLQSIEDESDHLVQLDHPRLKYCHKIWGSCDGLLCIQCREQTPEERSPPLYIWNPLTRESKKLLCFEGGRYFFVAGGFVYNTHLNDYQVVGVMHTGGGYCDYVFAIYSLSNDSWRRISPELDRNHKFWTYDGVTVNGFLHWVTRIHFGEETDDGYMPELDNALVRFDNKTENFAEVPLPDCLLPSICGVPTIILAEYQEKLALFYMCGDNVYLWVMNEYGVRDSWSKNFTIEILTDDTFREMKLCLTKNLLIPMGGVGKKLTLYNSVTNTQREIKGVHGVRQVTSNFMESIVGYNIFQRRKYGGLGRRKYRQRK